MDCRTSAGAAASLLVTFCVSLAAVGCATTDPVTSRMSGQTPPPTSPPPQPTPAPVLSQTTTTPVKKSDADVLKSKINILMYKADEEVKLARVGTAGYAADGKNLSGNEKSEQEKAALLDLARKDYQEVLKLEPRHLRAHQGLMHTYLRMGDHERAQKTIDDALVLSPRDPNLLFDKAICHSCRKQWKEAENSLWSALQIDPENPNFKKQLGFTLACEGQFDRSLEVLSQAYTVPGYAHYMVAKMLVGIFGQQEECKQHLRLALQANPKLDQASDLLHEMEHPEEHRVAQAPPPDVMPQAPPHFYGAE
jgi:tetratricopeptide (TPR) repeat protein